MRARPFVAAFVFVASVALAEEQQIPNWPAPPYWTRPAVPAGDERQEPGAPASPPALGRRSLTSGPVALPFVSLFPCRLVDTRAPLFPAPLGGGFLPPATVRSYTLTGVCGIPAGAQALSLNATVVHPTGPGFLTLYPEGGTFPPVSTLNYLGNDVIVNAAVVPLSATGGISMALGVSGGDVILDVNGYYADVPSVTSLNGLTGNLTLVPGANTNIASAPGTLTISSVGVLTGVTAGSGLAVTGGAPSPTVLIPPAGILADRIASGQVVKSLNGVADGVTIAGGGSTKVSTVGSTITVSSPPPTLVLTAFSAFTTGALSVDSWGCLNFDAAAVSGARLDLPLPTGAVITGVNVKVRDISTSAMGIVLHTIASTVSSASDSPVSSVLTPADTSWSILSLTGLSTSAQVSEFRTYYLDATAPVHAGLLAFCGATVTYTLP